MLNTLREEVEGFETIWKRLLKTPFYLVDRIGSIILAMLQVDNMATGYPPHRFFFFFCLFLFFLLLKVYLLAL